MCRENCKQSFFFDHYFDFIVSGQKGRGSILSSVLFDCKLGTCEKTPFKGELDFH